MDPAPAVATAEERGEGGGKAEELRYTGVSYKDTKGWQAQLYTAGKSVHLGNFNLQLEAAKQHDR